MTDYANAAARHWNDGKHLEAENRIDNADQLYGFAAECAIKSAIIKLPSNVNSPEVDKNFRHHIDTLWTKVPVQQLSKNFPGLVPILRMNNPFINWSVDQRYHDSGYADAATIQTHREITKRLMSAVQILGTRARN